MSLNFKALSLQLKSANESKKSVFLFIQVLSQSYITISILNSINILIILLGETELRDKLKCDHATGHNFLF